MISLCLFILSSSASLSLSLFFSSFTCHLMDPTVLGGKFVKSSLFSSSRPPSATASASASVSVSSLSSPSPSHYSSHSSALANSSPTSSSSSFIPIHREVATSSPVPAVKPEPTYSLHSSSSAPIVLAPANAQPLSSSSIGIPSVKLESTFNPFHSQFKSAAKSSLVSSSSSDSKPAFILIDVDQPISDLTCPECGPSAQVLESAHEGINVCQECGLQVGGNVISDESEWRNFGSDDSNKGKDDPSRVGGPESMEFHSFGLSTMMGKDADGNLSSLSRIHNQVSQSAGDKDGQKSAVNSKTLMDGFRKTSRFASILSLPQRLVDRANDLYRRLMESGEFPNRKQDVAIGTCLFIACKLDNLPRTMKEICAAGDLKQKDLGRCFTKIKKLRLIKKSKSGAATGSGTSQAAAANGHPSGSSAITTSQAAQDASVASVNDAPNLVERFCNVLRLPLDVTRQCVQVVQAANQLNIGEGRLPATLAGAAIYLVTSLSSAGNERTLTQISAVTHMAPNTIKNTFALLIKDKVNVLPAGFKEVVKDQSVL